MIPDTDPTLWLQAMVSKQDIEVRGPRPGSFSPSVGPEAARARGPRQSPPKTGVLHRQAEKVCYVRGEDMLDFPGRSFIEKVMPVYFLPRSEGVSRSAMDGGSGGLAGRAAGSPGLRGWPARCCARLPTATTQR